MMTFRTSGIAETQAGLRELNSELDRQLPVMVIDGTSQVETELKTYPPEPPYMGMRKYGSLHNTYVRTGYYGQNVHSSVVENGSKVTGYMEQGAPYSIWLRGDGNRYDGVWFHRPFWKSITAIVEEYTPKVVTMFTDRIGVIVQRIFGGGA